MLHHLEYNSSRSLCNILCCCFHEARTPDPGQNQDQLVCWYMITLTGSIPLFLCSPSQFWLTRYLRIPWFCNSTSAMCVGVGIACSVLVVLEARCLPCARRVQAPSGPRKSGMPSMWSANFVNIGISGGKYQTRRCRDAGPCKSNKVFALLNLVHESLGFAFQGVDSFEPLFSGDFGSRVCHDCD